MDNKVFVIGSTGKRLMPTTPRKARLLLKEGKVSVYQKQPFTIQLNYKTGGAVQGGSINLDTGEQHLGFAIIRDNVVLYKSEVELRKSMEKKILLVTRKEYRRGRRYRKVRYRHLKFKHKTIRRFDNVSKKWKKVPKSFTSDRPEGWLPPTIQSKVDHHINWINRFKDVLPDTFEIKIEVARFDVQKIQNPDIEGIDYQRGRLYQYENIKAYVLAKYNYTCPICGHKFDKEHKARLHHSSFRSKGATDNPDEFIPICDKCHTDKNHQPDEVLDKLRKANKRKEYREPVFMNIVAKRLRTAFPKAHFTYGNITNADRKCLGLPKTHANDAIAIGIGNKYDKVIDTDNTVYFKQVRKKKRSLHEANPRKGRKAPNREAKRNCKNVKSVTVKKKTYNLYDKILFNGQTGYISGFTGELVYVIDFEGNYLSYPDKKYKQVNCSDLKMLSHSSNWLSKIA